MLASRYEITGILLSDDTNLLGLLRDVISVVSLEFL